MTALNQVGLSAASEDVIEIYGGLSTAGRCRRRSHDSARVASRTADLTSCAFARSRRARTSGHGSAGLGPVRALARSGTDRLGASQRPLVSADHLVIDYRPSQPTGWGGVTIGGVASVPFIYQGTPYQISLLRFGQSGSVRDPVYELEPSDSRIDFKRTLQKAWGARYSFRYCGGFAGLSKLNVQSYDVTATQPTAARPQLSYGGDLLILYELEQPPAILRSTTDLRWIQVVHTQGESYVDSHGRNPYYSRAGLTSIHGNTAGGVMTADGLQNGNAAIRTGPISRPKSRAHTAPRSLALALISLAWTAALAGCGSSSSLSTSSSSGAGPRRNSCATPSACATTESRPSRTPAPAKAGTTGSGSMATTSTCQAR